MLRRSTGSSPGAKMEKLQAKNLWQRLGTSEPNID